MPDPIDTTAPHGRDAEGRPLAPFGLKKDGSPRISGRGRRPGPQKVTTARRTAAATKTATQKKETKKQLVGLVEMATMPLIAASLTPAVRHRIGEGQANALAGDGLILQSAAPDLADGLIALAESKPGVLAWMDRLEDAAPWMLLAQAGVQVTKAIVTNHLHPSADMAKAAQQLAEARAAQYVAEVERQAAAAAPAAEPADWPQPQPDPQAA